MYERTSVILLVTYLLQFSEQKKDRLVSLDSFHIGQNRRLDRTAESSVEWATNIFFCFSFHFDKSIYYLLQNLNLDKKKLLFYLCLPILFQKIFGHVNWQYIL